jgi:hypothetical protein
MRNSRHTKFIIYQVSMIKGHTFYILVLASCGVKGVDGVLHGHGEHFCISRVALLCNASSVL